MLYPTLVPWHDSFEKHIPSLQNQTRFYRHISTRVCSCSVVSVCGIQRMQIFLNCRSSWIISFTVPNVISTTAAISRIVIESSSSMKAVTLTLNSSVWDIFGWLLHELSFASVLPTSKWWNLLRMCWTDIVTSPYKLLKSYKICLSETSSKFNSLIMLRCCDRNSDTLASSHNMFMLLVYNTTSRAYAAILHVPSCTYQQCSHQFVGRVGLPVTRNRIGILLIDRPFVWAEDNFWKNLRKFQKKFHILVYIYFDILMHNCVQRSFTSAACPSTHTGFDPTWPLLTLNLYFKNLNDRWNFTRSLFFDDRCCGIRVRVFIRVPPLTFSIILVHYFVSTKLFEFVLYGVYMIGLVLSFHWKIILVQIWKWKTKTTLIFGLLALSIGS